MARYYIRNIDDHRLRWSDQDGWVMWGHDTYDEQQREVKRLPLHGLWMPVIRHRPGRPRRRAPLTQE